MKALLFIFAASILAAYSMAVPTKRQTESCEQEDLDELTRLENRLIMINGSCSTCPTETSECECCELYESITALQKLCDERRPVTKRYALAIIRLLDTIGQLCKSIVDVVNKNAAPSVNAGATGVVIIVAALHFYIV